MKKSPTPYDIHQSIAQGHNDFLSYVHAKLLAYEPDVLCRALIDHWEGSYNFADGSDIAAIVHSTKKISRSFNLLGYDIDAMSHPKTPD